jgi:hypothetical protein
LPSWRPGISPAICRPAIEQHGRMVELVDWIFVLATGAIAYHGIT